MAGLKSPSVVQPESEYVYTFLNPEKYDWQ